MAGSVPKILRAEWMAAAAEAGGFPEPGAPEVAFLGRSNVGKSSLLNRLVARRSLARTSATPGKTRLVHWYRVERPGREVWLVDLPGYGWARVARRERERWRPLIESYLGARPTLRAAVLLQDVRRDWGEDERLLVDWLILHEVPVLLALTKIDKLKPMRRARQIQALRRAIGGPAAHVLPTSATSGAGIPELWAAIDARLPEPGGR